MNTMQLAGRLLAIIVLRAGSPFAGATTFMPSPLFGLAGAVKEPILAIGHSPIRLAITGGESAREAGVPFHTEFIITDAESFGMPVFRLSCHFLPVTANTYQ